VKGYQGDGAPWNEFLGRPALEFTPALLHADALQALAQNGRTA
jgi:hypothetical protein